MCLRLEILDPIQKQINYIIIILLCVLITVMSRDAVRHKLVSHQIALRGETILTFYAYMCLYTDKDSSDVSSIPADRSAKSNATKLIEI